MAFTPEATLPGAAIRALRARFGLTRVQFAAILQATPSTVHRWETSVTTGVRRDTAGWIMTLLELPDPVFVPLRERVCEVFARGPWPPAWGVWTLLGVG